MLSNRNRDRIIIIVIFFLEHRYLLNDLFYFIVFLSHSPIHKISKMFSSKFFTIY